MKFLSVCIVLFCFATVIRAAPKSLTGDDQSGGPSILPGLIAGSAVSASVTTNANDIVVGKPITFAFSITNRSAKYPVKYQFSTSQKYDIVITDINGTEVWTWSKNRMFGQLITNESIGPGQTSVYKIKWAQRNDDDRPVPAGIYTATACLLPMARPRISGNLLTNPNSDPVNIGMPMMDNVQTGAVRINNTTPPLSAKTTFVIESNG